MNIEKLEKLKSGYRKEMIIKRDFVLRHLACSKMHIEGESWKAAELHFKEMMEACHILHCLEASIRGCDWKITEAKEKQCELRPVGGAA
ncbi:hypothetical protein M2447_001313 [Ereboglobus sp. PH5-10]|uniref:hypothetical protein n=1 Tax=Ereboglobus sp. PH5-10 TaxID=2940629 RepID=UPI002406E45B|nr:hypothetical protein [Ereboglobus sp. PH5-10]MDF9827224.1 hypothetical protein [Ereboglobus sp. PH5-10]